MLNRVVCALLALALLVGGLLTAIEIVLAGFEREPWLVPHQRWDRAAQTTPWSDADLRLALAALVAAGVLLLVIEAARRRPDELAMGGNTASDARLDRRSAERWLADRVERVEGVVGARVRLGRRKVAVRATPLGRTADGLEPRVRQAVARHLEELGLARELRVDVDVHPGGDGR